MASKAVFLDRDHTLIDDPGYLSDPGAVKVLPGVELAMKSLMGAGFKIVVATNQSGVARGLLTEETLAEIHAELRRQLAEKGAHIDAIYYCPFHPEGTVEAYAKESELRKPAPGMLLKAAAEMDLDLSASWMVGDNARDIEAGQRAGCRTIRLRQNVPPLPGEVDDESFQADYTVKNLVEAARIILYEAGQPARQVEAVPAAGEGKAMLDESKPPVAAETKEKVSTPAGERIARPAPADRPRKAGQEESEDQRTRLEILRYVRQVAQTGQDEFSVSKLIAGIAQVLAVFALILTVWRMVGEQTASAHMWAQIATVLQLMALTFFIMNRPR